MPACVRVCMCVPFFGVSLCALVLCVGVGVCPSCNPPCAPCITPFTPPVAPLSPTPGAAFLADRDTLRDQLSTAPAHGDPNDMAINVAKVRDLEARLLEEREEKASMMSEKQALQVGVGGGRRGGH